MKKLLALLICLAMLPAFPAMAGERAQISLFRLTVTDENGQETEIGSAIPALDGQCLFTNAIIDDAEAVKAYGPDGVAYQPQFVTERGSGIAMLVLDQAAGCKVPALSKNSAYRSRLVGVTRHGLTYDMPAISVVDTVYQGMPAVLVSAKEPLRPGAVLVDDQGDLIGMTVAEWGEGEARYVALTGDVMMDELLTSMLVEPEKVENPKIAGRTSWLLDAYLIYWDGMLAVDWSDSEIDGLNSRSVMTVYVECASNNYYVYYTADPSDGVMFVDVAPGYEYRVWVNHSYGMPDLARLAEYALEVKIPEAGNYGYHGFTNECYLAWAPAEDTPDVSEKLPALEPITAEALEDAGRKLYLQAMNTYAIDEELETSLTLVLQSPEGYVFHSLSGYIFMPDIQDEDVWNAEVTPLFKRYLTYSDTSSFAPGEYTLSYLISGEWAGSVTFTLE